MSTRPAWAEIYVSAIEDNIKVIAGLLGPASRICAVVKADGYGHGALACARAALAGGASSLAVALLDEGIALREAGIGAPILLLGAVQAEEAEAAIQAGLEATVFSEKAIRAFDQAGRKAGAKARLHLKIDTGMSRVGCAPAEAPGLASLIAGLPGTALAGCYSHFANSDDPDLAFARRQLKLFLSALAAIEARGIRIPLRHIANSAAALWLPEARLDMVRIGIAMYGLRPDHARPFPEVGFRPALAVRARVTRLALVEPGATVSYGRTWAATRPTRVATVSLGYADGYPRILSGLSWAGFEGRRLPQVGRVCMDMCMFDATDAPDLEEGGEITLMGPGGPSLEEVADLAKTINYEIACSLGLRLPHLVSQGGS